MCKLLHDQSKPGPPLPSEIDEYSNNLKKEYSSYKLRQIVDWPLPPTENFIRLAMIREQEVRRGELDPQFINDMTQGKVADVLRKEVEIQPDEIFEHIKPSNGEHIKPSNGEVILVEGAPGSGKTTLCWYTCKQWGEGKCFQQFSHVLMVELRDRYTQAAKCLADLLPFCEGREGNRIAEQMEQGGGENVLIILEGWDQLPQSLRQREDSMFQELIRKKAHRCLLRQAVVLISSRSSVTADLHSSVSMRIETLGFTPDHIERYVCSSFQGKPEKAKKLLTKIRENPRLEGNCYLPLFLMLIVHLYSYDYQLPKSFCGVIIELALTCLYHYRRNTLKRTGANINSFDDLPDDIGPLFLHLCELAYNATMEERYSFSNLETENLLGLMQTVESLSSRENQTTQYFLHSSLQELCAAVHISIQEIPVQKGLIKKAFDSPKDYVLRFYSALTHWKNEDMAKALRENSEKLCEETSLLVSAKPEVLSEHIVPVMPVLENFFSTCAQVLEYALDVVVGDKPFDRDKLASLLNDMVNSQDVTSEMCTILEDKMMKLSDASFNPGDSPAVNNEIVVKVSETMVKVWDQVATEKGIDEPILKAFGQEFLEQHFGLQVPFLQNIEQFMEEIFEAFGTTDIPEEVLRDQVIQKVQQDIMKKQATEDPRSKMGIPMSPEQQVSHAIHNVLLDGWKKYADGMLFQSQLMDGADNSSMCMKLVQKHIHNTTTSLQQLAASSFHKSGAQNMLMLIHCIYEANNPKLTQILGSSLKLMGELNASDLIALQSVLSMKYGSRSHSKLEQLVLMSAIPEMQRVVEVIKATSTIHTLILSVGHYDEELVRTVLQKPTIRFFRYNWIIENEKTCACSCNSLASCLKNNQSLQAFELLNVPILDVGAEALAGVLNTTQLVEIDLSRCGITEKGIIALSTALANNVFLNVLQLNDTTISPAALQHLSMSLRQNNTLKVLGMVEDPTTTELSEENIEEFIQQLNPSVVYILLHGIRIHAPILQRALSLVNATRKLKLQPQLSISDHYPSFLLEELPFQVWSQTLVFSFQFIREMKAARNVSMCHILPKTIRFNACSQKSKPSYIFGVLYSLQEELPLQLQYQTLCHTLQSMEKSKAICNLSMRHLLSIRSQKCKPSCLSVVVSPIQQKLPFQIQQQTLSHTLQSIQMSKIIRNLSMRHLLCTKM